MKNYLIVCIMCLTASISGQENDIDQIKATLGNYMHGSSYNNMEEIKSAFTEDATLYLTVRDTLKKLSPVEYAGFFKRRTKGEYNGREAKILATEIIKDIAWAKVEILIPARKMRYVDLFLLKKGAQGWRIISKTATRTDNN